MQAPLLLHPVPTGANQMKIEEQEECPDPFDFVNVCSKCTADNDGIVPHVKCDGTLGFGMRCDCFLAGHVQSRLREIGKVKLQGEES